MKRYLETNLLSWSAKKEKKPLLIQGARQTGKTYLIKQFGENHFSRYFLLDFERKPQLRELFRLDRDPRRILGELESLLRTKLVMERDLVIFDEVQSCPEALSALKYLREDFPGANFIASGSLLGVSLGEIENFPVGQVERLTLYPLSFSEFLEGIEETETLEHLRSMKISSGISQIFHEKVLSLLKIYFCTGGLPEAINTYMKFRDRPLELALDEVREVQNDLLLDYRSDIAKHSGKHPALRINAVFDSIPTQLAREIKYSRRYTFKGVLPKYSNFANLEGPIEWLNRAGLLHKVSICNKAELPLKAYTDTTKFLLYLFDVGILGALSGLTPADLLSSSYGSYKGYFSENFALQQLVNTVSDTIFSWQENTAQIEFLLSGVGKPVPIEVKAGMNTKAKSLQVFFTKYAPETTILLSAQSTFHREKDGRLYIPLYMVERVKEFIS